jgi:glutamate synthase domain-containing protein 2/NAD-dependent dihydropyrimidine dehydrogenase PreA subunit
MNKEATTNSDSRVNRAPSRFRNPVPKYTVRRSSACIKCGKCAEVCPYGVHERLLGSKQMRRPKSHFCIGTMCEKNDFYCVRHCPVGAISVKINPGFASLGDFRWTGDLILNTWYQAEYGKLPPGDLEYRTGNSGGGFDKLRFKFPKDPPKETDLDEISTAIDLNVSRDNRPEVTIDIPMYGGGMSFGSISEATMLGRARCMKKMNSFTCTGEGGYPEQLKRYDDNVITQIATGLFGVREETIQRVRIVEFKYAQGAKPGLGGHLLGDKNTPDVAMMRETVVGAALFSPFPFHSVYSVEDHKKHVDWIKQMNPKALVSVKVSTPTDVDMVAVGSYYAGAHIIHLDGSYGGTAAAPDIAKKNIAMPIEYAIPRVHNFLTDEGIRDRVALIVSGGIRTAYDVAKSIALGANGVVIGTAEMIALECVRCGNCESGRGCARGIATTDRELSNAITERWAANRMTNMYVSWQDQLKRLLNKFGMKSIKELVGRTDLLVHLDYTDEPVEADYL